MVSQQAPQSLPPSRWLGTGRLLHKRDPNWEIAALVSGLHGVSASPERAQPDGFVPTYRSTRPPAAPAGGRNALPHLRAQCLTGRMDEPGESRQQNTARASYNRMSKVYAFLSDESEQRFVSDAIEGMLEPQPGESVLEPGFGTGQVLVALAELVGDTGRVAGIDISDGMLEQTRKRVTEQGLADRVDLQLGSATELPYADDTFDAVFMSFTLELFPDDQIPVVLAECRRVLKPSGRLCVACMSSEGGIPTMERLYEWSHRAFPTIVDCRPIDAAAALMDNGFAVEQRKGMSMWGLAVDLILARP